MSIYSILVKATGIRTSEVHVVTAARSLNSAYNKSFKRTNNSWLFAPSSPILANYYLPLNEALGLQGYLEALDEIEQ